MKFVAAAIVSLACLFACTARAAEIDLEPSAVRKLVEQSLFKDRGRLMLLRGACEAWLDRPAVTLAGGRVEITARLAGRIGASTGNGCLGVDLNSPTRISGVPAAAGGSVRLRDVRVEVSDPSARQMMDELGLSSLMPTVIDLDVQGAVKTMLTQYGGDLQATVESFTFQDVAVIDGRLVTRFDFKLSGR